MTEHLMTVKEYCSTRKISRDSFYDHKRAGRLKGCFRKKPGGKRQLVIPSKADKALDENVRFNAGAEATKSKFRGGQTEPQAPEAPETQEEIEDYLNESIGDLSQLSIFELQRRNELEKLLMAQIKRREASKELIDAEAVERSAFEAGKTIKEGCLGIADRAAPLVASEGDSFQCKQILLQEINYILENLSKLLRVPPASQQAVSKTTKKGD